VPGVRIDSVTYVRGDAAWVRVGLTWMGNDAGYPSYAKNVANVVLEWRGTIAPCFVAPVCGAKRHPWVRIVFSADNTMTKEVGVA
jgi:hypothetical protein